MLITDFAVRVEYLGLIRNVLDCGEEEYLVTSDSTIKALVEKLGQRHGAEVRALLLTAEGYLRSSVEIYLEGDEIRSLQGLDTPIAKKGTVAVVLGISPFPGG